MQNFKTQKSSILPYITAFLSKKVKQAHILQNAKFDKRKIADTISDFVVGVTRIELAAS